MATVKKTTMYWDSIDYARLDEAARRAGKPVAALVREIVARELNTDGDPMLPRFGLLASGRFPARHAKRWVRQAARQRLKSKLGQT